jgi:hypothetical protein
MVDCSQIESFCLSQTQEQITKMNFCVLYLICFFLPFGAGFVREQLRPSFAAIRSSKPAFQKLTEPPVRSVKTTTEKKHSESISVAPVSVVKLTWEPEAAEKIRKAITDQIKNRGENERLQPYMVAVVGIPGSGKVRSKVETRVHISGNDEPLTILLCSFRALQALF